MIAKGLVRVIERREPTPEEVADPDTIVFDIGGQHSQDLNSFDHHQFERDAAATCAFSLVLLKHGDYADWNAIFPWIKGTEEMDSKGPFAVAKMLSSKADPHNSGPGLSMDDLAPFFFNPFAGFVIEEFQKDTVINSASSCWHLLRRLGISLIDKVDAIRLKWKHFDKTTKLHTLHGLVVAEFDTTGPLGIETWLRRTGNEQAAVVVSRDDRGDGLALFRRNDDQRVDFSKCEDATNVIFAHKGGFVAKTTDSKWRAPLALSVSFS